MYVIHQLQFAIMEFNLNLTFKFDNAIPVRFVFSPPMTTTEVAALMVIFK